MTWSMESPAEVDEFHLRHPDGHVFRVNSGLGAVSD